MMDSIDSPIGDSDLRALSRPSSQTPTSSQFIARQVLRASELREEYHSFENYVALQSKAPFARPLTSPGLSLQQLKQLKSQGGSSSPFSSTHLSPRSDSTRRISFHKLLVPTTPRTGNCRATAAELVARFSGSPRDRQTKREWVIPKTAAPAEFSQAKHHYFDPLQDSTAFSWASQKPAAPTATAAQSS
eukprot:TRINITY_DN35262_c0_g1_i1.p1 TRINITY_DN35262_c0_g1~~TRINITY_DN35262_c0_g1_i1.p1  ORF type:complete len:189 (+),score=28.17 TRINITY_DN35262_c0_g1_i1:128-694(+)